MYQNPEQQYGTRTEQAGTTQNTHGTCTERSGVSKI